MALVAVRSSNEAASPQCSNSDKEADEEDGSSKKSKSEMIFSGKEAPLGLLSLRDAQQQNAERRLSTDSIRSTNSIQSNNSDIQQHLQSMFYLLRHEETLKMAVKLESQHANRTRYLVIASRCCQRPGVAERKCRPNKNNTTTTRQTTSTATHQVTNETVVKTNNSRNLVEEGMEESCLLGIDCNESTTLGLVVPILADTTIRLDGDGGFSVKVYDKTYIFKPVSVQAMWSALQTLHKVSQKARENNFYFSGPSHDWLSYYESHIESDQSCLNEWHAMDSLESRRPPSPDAMRNKPTAKEETESIIKMKLKEIMMSVDLDEVTSKYIRSRLEEQLDMDLDEFKEFIDVEMLTILGQMDAPTEIFEHVYLGSEWNASNLEELQKNGVRHILNVTREIDNFFPGMFDYFNVRVYDDEKTNLLKHWDNTFRYITRAKAEGSKVLVHCKMGVSRSASVVIAYAMKAYNWEFQQALQHVKGRRSCIKPNKNFLNQLETYRGMLDAMKNKEKLQRSKSETNLKCNKDGRLLPGSEPTPLIQALNQSKSKSAGYEISSRDANVQSVSELSNDELNKLHKDVEIEAKSTRQRRVLRRSSSSSPKTIQRQSASSILGMGGNMPKQQSQSLENLTPERSIVDEPKNMRFPGSNGENYSVTQNQVLHIQKNTPPQSVRNIIQDLETHHGVERKVLKLPFSRSISHETTTNWNCCHDELITERAVRKPPSAHRKTQSWVLNNPVSNIKLPIDENSESVAQRTSVSLPSRHASWGSGDQRCSYLPRIRNSSWSAYDTNRNYNTKAAAIYENQILHSSVDNNTKLSYKTAPIPFFEATLDNTTATASATATVSSVKRTTQFLEEHHCNKYKHNYQQDQRRKHLYRSTSAAGTTTTTGNKQNHQDQHIDITDLPYTISDIANKNMTTNLQSMLADDDVILRGTPTSTATLDEQRISSGNVKVLKKNFEARASTNTASTTTTAAATITTTTTTTDNTATTTMRKKVGHHSLPSSPVAQHVDYNLPTMKQELQPINNSNSAIDAGVKGLVHKYQATATNTNTSTSTNTLMFNVSSNTTNSSSTALQHFKPRPRSYYDFLHKNLDSHVNPLRHEYNENRPPPIPIKERVEQLQQQPKQDQRQQQSTSTVNTNLCTLSHKRLRQHGKTHPLSRLSLPKENFNAAAYNTM